MFGSLLPDDSIVDVSFGTDILLSFMVMTGFLGTVFFIVGVFVLCLPSYLWLNLLKSVGEPGVISIDS